MQSTNKRKPRLWMIAFTFLVVSTLGVVLFVRSGQTSAATSPLDNSTKTATPDTVSPGGTVNYEIVLRNESASETTGAIVVTDTLATELTYVSQSAMVEPETAGVGMPITGGVKFTVNSMSAGDVVTLSFSVEVGEAVSAGTVIPNTADIAFDSSLLQPSVNITVESAPESKIVSPWDEQLVNAGSSTEISGRAVTDSQSPEFPDTPVLDITYVPPASNYWVTWTDVPEALTYTLQESDSVDFSNITYENDALSTTMVERSGMADGTYYYRVMARNAYGDSYWSNVETVTVVSSSSALLDLPEDELAPASVTVPNYQPVVEIQIFESGGTEPGWTTVTDVIDPASRDWWEWTYDWTVPDNVGGQYVIQTRAKDLSGNAGPVDEITVTVISGETVIYLPIVFREYPPVPTLSVTADDGEGNFSLGWTIPSSDWTLSGYRLQESETSDFAVLTLDQTLSATARAFTDHDSGTYYYRVAGVSNLYGLTPWSNVVSVDVASTGYFDDFSDAGSGWPIATYKRGTDPDGEFFSVWYGSGTYNLKILLDYASLNNKWMGIVKAPYTNELDNYTVQVDHHFSKADDQASPPSYGKAGLVFAANSDMTVLYQVEWNYEGLCAVAKYWSVAPPGARWDPNSIAMSKTWSDCTNVLHTGYDAVNTVKVVVEGKKATIYINGAEIHQQTSDEFYTYNTVGLTTGAYERTPVESRFDNFTVTEN